MSAHDVHGAPAPGGSPDMEDRTSGPGPYLAEPIESRPVESRPTFVETPIADPGPLGLAAFALTTFVLSVFNANIVSVTLAATVLPIALFYGGLAQLLAGMWEFKKNNTFGALAFASYGAFWMCLAAYDRFVVPDLKKSTAAADVHQATGLFLLAWTIFTLIMLFASLRITGALALLFVVLTATFAVLTWAWFAGTGATPAPNVLKAGGVLGIITAFVAWYIAMAGVANAVWRHTVLPVYDLGRYWANR